MTTQVDLHTSIQQLSSTDSFTKAGMSNWGSPRGPYGSHLCCHEGHTRQL